MDHEKVGRRGEAYILLLASTIGMSLMASAADLIMLYLAIETTSIPLYVLAGFMLSDDRSTEAGFKYLLFGAMTSAVMLYGFSLLYGFTGTTNFYALADAFKAGQIAAPVIFGVIILLIVGLGFKVSIVPFHFWAPDVYEGAPTPVSGFLSTASKAAGFAVIARLFLVVFHDFTIDWMSAFAVLSAVTMTVGNLLALPQKNFRKDAGLFFHRPCGLCHDRHCRGIKACNCQRSFLYGGLYRDGPAAFGVVVAVGCVVGSDDYDAYKGLSRRSPLLGLIMLAQSFCHWRACRHSPGSLRRSLSSQRASKLVLSGWLS